MCSLDSLAKDHLHFNLKYCRVKIVFECNFFRLVFSCSRCSGGSFLSFSRLNNKLACYNFFFFFIAVLNYFLK